MKRLIAAAAVPLAAVGPVLMLAGPSEAVTVHPAAGITVADSGSRCALVTNHTRQRHVVRVTQLHTGRYAGWRETSTARVRPGGRDRVCAWINSPAHVVGSRVVR